MLKWEPYEEKYFFLITDMYDILDGIQAKDAPSIWKFTTEGLKKHNMALSQIGTISDAYNTPTVCVLKFKTFSDFTLHISLRIRDKGKAGVVFRYID